VLISEFMIMERGRIQAVF